MQNCRQCGRKTSGVLASGEDETDFIYIPNMCEGCMWELGASDAAGTPTLTCEECDSSCTIKISNRCRDCHISLLDVIDNMPKVEPMEPPMGYIGIIGCDDIQAEMEVMSAYNGTPAKDELEN